MVDGGQKQAQSQPLAPAALGDQRFKQVRPDFLRNAGTCVCQANRHLGARRAVRIEPNENLSALAAFRGLERIGRQGAHKLAYHVCGYVDTWCFMEFGIQGDSLRLGLWTKGSDRVVDGRARVRRFEDLGPAFSSECL